ncbi:MAG: ribonuclease J [bacterium]|nr:ribonuclease J [bacterium]
MEKHYYTRQTSPASREQALRLIPLGGLGEVGRNMMLLEYGEKILIIDMGLRFPEETMPGVDYIIPNIEYLKDKTKNVVGAVFTHGHYDHIGAVPYLVRVINPRLPLFASPLTKGIIIKRQGEFPDSQKLDITEVRDGSRIVLGPFKIEFVMMNHNIPDSLAIFISTPVGNLFYTSDFKFDSDPIYAKPTSFKRLREIGSRRILLLLSDSTGAEEPGHSLSEKEIFKNLEEIFKMAKGRIIAATFASLINRLQQLITISEKYGRKVIIEGYSMRTNLEIAKALGYIKTKKGTVIKAKDVDSYPDDKITILCTGSQGEGSAVLMRIANKEHKSLRIKKGDGVIFSSSTVPGNERQVQNLKDEFFRQGAKVFHYGMMDIHAGGHAQQEELKEMIRIMNPRFFLPIHGQVSMLVSHLELAREMGIAEKNSLMAETGKVIGLTSREIWLEKKEVPSDYIMVDGLGIGDVGEVVLRDRQVLAKDGMFVIIATIDRKTGQVQGSPDIISRGFVYLRESKELLRDTRKKVIGIINRTAGSGGAVNWTYVKEEIKNKVGDFLYQQTQRRPMILPVVIEV